MSQDPETSGSSLRRSIGTLLERYRPDDSGEAEHVDAMRALLALAGDVTTRRHFEPGHFTASAFVWSPGAGALLLILHGKLGRWLQPGGHLEPGDPDVEAAARREVAEETGIEAGSLQRLGDGLFDVDVHPIPGRGDEPGHRHFDLRFAFTAKSDRLRPGDEVRGARWVPLSEVLGLGTDDSVRRAVRKLETVARSVSRDPRGVGR